MPATTHLDHRISRAYEQLKEARHAGSCVRIQHWREQLDALLEEKLIEMERASF